MSPVGKGRGKLKPTGWIKAFDTTDRDAPAPTHGTGHGRGVLAIAHGGVWVANRASRTVARLDPRSLELRAIQKFRKAPVGIAAGPEAIWAVGSNGWLWRLWPDAQRAEGVARLGRRATAIAVAGDLVWVLRRHGRLFGLDPASGEVMLEGRVPRGAGHMVSHDGALWVSCRGDRRIVRFDPHTGRMGVGIEVPGRVRCLTAAGDALLAGSARRLPPKRGWLHTIDVSNQALAATVGLPSQPRAIAVDGETAWVACGEGLDRAGTIERVDLGDGAVAEWWETNWTVADLALLGDKLLASMSLELATPVVYGQYVGGGGDGGGGGGGGN